MSSLTIPMLRRSYATKLASQNQAVCFMFERPRVQSSLLLGRVERAPYLSHSTVISLVFALLGKLMLISPIFSVSELPKFRFVIERISCLFVFYLKNFSLCMCVHI